MHKVIHLVVGTFEKGFKTPSAPYIEKTEVTISDRMLASIGMARSVRRSSEDASVGL